ncbi:hypothetical protein OEZ84_26365, partial [Leclercia adecarboxylata]|uniref:hypothetical protein n=1 Tax=Leclercia adecarboxylata TaxID=83655 RepID=UPI00234CF961
VEPCALAQQLVGHGDIGPCRMLELEDGRYWCGLVRNPDSYAIEGSMLARLLTVSTPDSLGRVYGEMLGVNKGCCAGDDAIEAPCGEDEC